MRGSDTEGTMGSSEVQAPNDANRAQMIVAAQMQDFLYHFRWCMVRHLMRDDIRNVYQSGPNAADAAVATFERQRVEGARRLEYAGARADAGADLIEIREATTRAMSRIGERVDNDPDTGGPNRSSPALTEGDVLASLAQIRA